MKRQKNQDTDKVKIVHPSFDVYQDFLVFGFKETIFDGRKAVDHDLFVISSANEDRNEILVTNENTIERKDYRIFLDKRNRILMSLEERWSKKELEDFIENPASATPKEVFQKIRDVLKQYVEFQVDAHYDIIVAWVIGTHFFRIFNAFPFLFFLGSKQSGKSRCLEVIERLAFNAVKTKHISVAAMADTLDGIRGTLLLDQAESLSEKNNAEMISLLADSYTPGGGKRRLVTFTQKRERKVIEFETYGPKAFASTVDLETDLRDRCAQISMLRSRYDYPYPEKFLPVWPDLRNELYRLALKKWQSAKNIYPYSGEDMIQRLKELWRPIETVLLLSQIPRQRIKVIQTAFIKSTSEMQADLSDWELELFEKLLMLLKKKGTEIFSVYEIATNMSDCTNYEISQKGMETWVGKTLRLYNLYDRPAPRKEGKRAYRFSYDRIRDIFDRYNSESSGISG